MVDPVIDPDGNSYERKAIEEWLGKNSVSPVTRNPLTVAELRPNRALKDSIDLVRAQVSAGELKKDPGMALKAAASFEPNLSLDVQTKGDLALITLSALATPDRSPVELAVVIDVSGSMNAAASLKDSSGNVEETGLCVLDITKHAVRTIITSMKASDKLSLVTFSSSASTVVKSQYMNDQGKKKAIAAMEAMKPGGGTNIWDGLKMGMDNLHASDAVGANKAVMLLTDGEPNVIPPRGHIPMLKSYIDKKGLPGSILTFGFGYSLDSQLLVDLASIGHGAFAFIPDSTLVGTVFIHSLSKVLTTVATHLNLSLEVSEASEIVKVFGVHESTKASWGQQIHFGGINNGQQLHVLVKTNSMNTTPFTATLAYSTLDGKPHSVSVEDTKVSEDDAVFSIQQARLLFAEVISEELQSAGVKRGAATDSKLAESCTKLKELAKTIRALPHSDHKVVVALLADLEGQAMEAMSKVEFYRKWGRHYLPSLFRAHLDESCNNFKDPGVQHYGGVLFNQIRDEIDDIFLELPPPKASLPPRTKSSYGAKPGSSPAPQRSSYTNFSYHSSSNPCFTGDCLVTLANGTTAPIRSLKKGQELKTPSGVAKLDCLLITETLNGTAELCQLPNGLTITPWHPVLLEGQWHFPGHLTAPQSLPCSQVYNLLLQPSSMSSQTTHVAIINETYCVTMGHGLTGRVVEHPYFGSQQIVADIQSMEGYEEGIVHLSPNALERDPITLCVTALRQTIEVGSH
eukprot:TRINITY_DN5402_c0_g1_i1.p1 TRINITY_DN5402_c0_g1~~TRINITY_DN5402_c0_g1_i1.p1  ORF type:complete len:763 (-),score=155.00 TRINITY_DN5402_c0_g1_i1:7-2235(-)